MLSFTTILPTIYVTERFAKWSSYLNRDIQVSLGQANSVATQSFGNIRTVRAMSTEKIEVGNYHEKNLDALRRGIKDALV